MDVHVHLEIKVFFCILLFPKETLTCTFYISTLYILFMFRKSLHMYFQILKPTIQTVIEASCLRTAH